ASLALFDMELTLENATRLATAARERLEKLRGRRGVIATRQAGTMVGIDLQTASDGRRVAHALYERGQFTRAIGKVIQLVPPLSSTESEIHAFFDAFEAVAE
ncbi:MAG: aminotransferase class III-fold pyridoxal phosphate-dependent enzyme, partial [Candidatus Eremiobacteraeota bacterium]|nr:aminotransferase class III-fold pyridoxal phosphate-dependent enzyme [Candidatus Eremiobacteraeota bacterium]